MRPHLFMILSMLSLLLCVPTVVVWVLVVIAPQIGVYDVTIGSGRRELRLNPSTPIWIALIFERLKP